MAQSAKGVPKQDTSPSSFSYKDRGCSVSPSCLACPLPQCVLDTPGMITKAHYSARVAAIKVAAVQGKTQAEIAAEVGCSSKTVYRALAER